MKLDKELQNQTASELVWIMSQEIPSEIALQWYEEDREEPLEELIQMYRNEQKAKSQSTYTPKQEALKMLPLVMPPEELMKITREFHLKVLELNNPPNKEQLIEQINQAKTTKEMWDIMLPNKFKKIPQPKWVRT